jgi:Putative zinc-finger
VTWHVNRNLLDRYAAATVSAAEAASVETHLTGCAECRSAIAPLADRRLLDAAKVSLDDQLDATTAPGPVRFLRAVGLSDADAAVAGASFALPASVMLAGSSALAFAVAASAMGRGGFALTFFLIVAPLLPLVGVALAFGPRVDPTHELSTACPMSTGRMLLLRSVVVLGVCLPVIALLSPLVSTTPLAFAWVLPALALAAGTLALGTWVPMARAAVGLGVLWVTCAIIGIRGASRASAEAFAGSLDVFQLSGQLLCAVVLVAAIAVLTFRLSSYEVTR